MPEPSRIREVKIDRILNPTSIDLGEYVINPYKGCELGCVYCYVKTNRATWESPRPWGSYVDVRTNSPEQLEKELAEKEVKTVLLGSTTELFQPIEKKYQLTRRILEVLNEKKVHYVILTRAPAILDALPLLTKGFCQKIYFTINLLDDRFKRVLELKSSDFKSRARAIEILMDQGLRVVSYFCPVLPWVSDYENAFAFFQKSDPLEFEFLNFTLRHIDEIIDKISSVDSEIGQRYRRMRQEKTFYARVWEEVRNRLEPLARASGRNYRFFVHQYEGYFENRYHSVSL
jgi:DNA repair photolyase